MFDAAGVPIYDGKINVTETGRICQRWDTNTPHKIASSERMSSEHENYCRTPDNWDRLWCYTMDPAKEWEFCDVPECSEYSLKRNG